MGKRRSYFVALSADKEGERVTGRAEVQLRNVPSDMDESLEAQAIGWTIQNRHSLLRSVDPATVEYLYMPMPNCEYRLHQFQRHLQDMISDGRDVLRILSGQAAAGLEKN